MDELFAIPPSDPDPLHAARVALTEAEAEYAQAAAIVDLQGPEAAPRYSAIRNKVALCRNAVRREELRRLNP
jgi:hypothetical protein